MTGGSASRCSAPSRTRRRRSAFPRTSASAGRSSLAPPERSRPRSASEATKQELAEATGLPIQHVDEALGAAQASVSLNQTVGAGDEGELGDLFADREAADPFDEAEESLRRQCVRRALDALPERERRILELRFGFEGEPWTLEAIGHELDLTRERVRQLEGQALARLAALRELQFVTA